MAETKIEWADFTFNHVRGCTKVSPACENCYADTMSGRNPRVLGVWGKHGTRVVAAESYWKLPIKWNKQAEVECVRKRVFCASLADVFEGDDTMPDSAIPAVKEARLRLFELIDKTPHLDWLLLTKRPDNVRHVMDEVTLGTYGEAWNFAEHMPNVWIGTTVENQKYADIRIPELLKIPAKVRFLSVEPMLGPVDLTAVNTFRFVGAETVNTLTGKLKDIFGVTVGYAPSMINFVICGGESGHKARPMHPDWVRSIRDQCQAAGTPFHFKQFGEWIPRKRGVGEFNSLAPHNRDRLVDVDGNIHSSKEAAGEEYACMSRVGKKKAGRILDGREWNELPEVSL